jgi:hypothetical protein
MDNLDNLENQYNSGKNDIGTTIILIGLVLVVVLYFLSQTRMVHQLVDNAGYSMLSIISCIFILVVLSPKTTQGLVFPKFWL